MFTRWMMTGSSIALFCCFTLAQEPAQPTPMSLSEIIQGLEKSQAAQFSYRVIREYRLFGADTAKANSDVIAELIVRQPVKSDYTVQQTSGSSRGQQIIRGVLDHEVEAMSSENQARIALTRNNYDFVYLGEATVDGQTCYKLGLQPKRNAKELIRGEAWVDKHSLFVREIQGEVAKSPSWWLKSVHVKFVFAQLEGAWMQTSMEAVADVRVVGVHTLTSQIRDYRGVGEVASITPAPLPRHDH